MAAKDREWPRMLILLVVLIAGGVPARAEKAEVQAAFTPGDNIAAMIIERIREARGTIRMQAYLFTDRRIANALVGAARRGVRVDIVADGSQQVTGGSPYLEALRRAGAHVFLTEMPGAAHNKV